ncbi:hypothetical protein DFH09DRAFT_1273156 [Mycena vulgaris]|nr:hypothetical protein DFH09DRAFT_1273156 [Mycena vulgaris]
MVAVLPERGDLRQRHSIVGERLERLKSEGSSRPKNEPHERSSPPQREKPIRRHEEIRSLSLFFGGKWQHPGVGVRARPWRAWKKDEVVSTGFVRGFRNKEGGRKAKRGGRRERRKRGNAGCERRQVHPARGVHGRVIAGLRRGKERGKIARRRARYLPGCGPRVQSRGSSRPSLSPTRTSNAEAARPRSQAPSVQPAHPRPPKHICAHQIPGAWNASDILEVLVLLDTSRSTVTLRLDFRSRAAPSMHAAHARGASDEDSRREHPPPPAHPRRAHPRILDGRRHPHDLAPTEIPEKAKKDEKARLLHTHHRPAHVRPVQRHQLGASASSALCEVGGISITPWEVEGFEGEGKGAGAERGAEKGGMKVPRRRRNKKGGRGGREGDCEETFRRGGSKDDDREEGKMRKSKRRSLPFVLARKKREARARSQPNGWHSGITPVTRLEIVRLSTSSFSGP